MVSMKRSEVPPRGLRTANSSSTGIEEHASIWNYWNCIALNVYFSFLLGRHLGWYSTSPRGLHDWLKRMAIFLLFPLFRSYVAHQMPIKSFTPDWHLKLMEGVFGHVIRIEFVHPSNDDIDIRLVRFGKQQELHARKSLEAGQTEMGGFKDFNAGALG